MDDVQAIIEVVNGVAIYADLRQWDALRRLYADRVAVDYTSFIGGTPAEVDADALIEGWKSGLGRYHATQHLLGNHRVTFKAEIAEALVYVQATHWLPQTDGDSTWTVHGYYDYTLRQHNESWTITQHKFTATIVYGSRRLLEMQGVKPEWIAAGGR